MVKALLQLKDIASMTTTQIVTYIQFVDCEVRILAYLFDSISERRVVG